MNSVDDANMNPFTNPAFAVGYNTWYQTSGVFALHSLHQPNPIGVIIVELVEVAGNVLTLRGLMARQVRDA